MRSPVPRFPFALAAAPLLPFVLLACGATTAPPPAPVPPIPPVASAPAAVPTPATIASFPVPPTTRRDDVHEVLHGVDIVDPYRWLEDQDSPETRAWIDAQNAYTHALLDGQDGRASIRARLSALARYDDQGTPYAFGGRRFTMQHRKDDDLWTLHVSSVGHAGKKGRRCKPALDHEPLAASNSPLSFIKLGFQGQAETTDLPHSAQVGSHAFHVAGLCDNMYESNIERS